MDDAARTPRPDGVLRRDALWALAGLAGGLVLGLRSRVQAAVLAQELGPA